MLEVSNLSIRYGDAVAVRNLDFTIAESESVGLVGESGSGKTQTALALLGLLPRSADVDGSIKLNGAELLGAGEKTLNRIRATNIAMVFQDPMLALNPYLPVGAQLRRILLRHRLADRTASKRRAIEMLERVGLPDAQQQYRAYPHQLSGGMRQRAMIASALIAEPQLLVADEPTTALDVTVQAQILQLLEELRQETALLLITHDLGVVAGHCERMLVLERGALVEQGDTREVFSAPRHEHTRALLAAAPRLSDAPPAPTVGGETLFEIEGARVSYGRDRERLAAVRDVDLKVARGETLAVVGESGSGKSSLVRAALGLVPMQAGRVVYSGTLLSGAAQTRSRAVRRGVQLVFQDPVGSLNPQMRVADIVAEPLLVHEDGMTTEARLERVESMLAKTGLGEEFLPRYPHELSGGQAQRVAIARALVLDPEVLVCDEAVAALDGTVRTQILALLQQIQAETGLAIVFITHDLSVVRLISHRVLVMYLGNVVELADNEALFARPGHPYTQALLDAVPVPDPNHPGGKMTIGGESPSALRPPAGCAFHPRCRFVADVCRRDAPVLQPTEGSTVSCHLATEVAAARR